MGALVSRRLHTASVKALKEAELLLVAWSLLESISRHASISSRFILKQGRPAPLAQQQTAGQQQAADKPERVWGRTTALSSILYYSLLNF